MVAEPDDRWGRNRTHSWSPATVSRPVNCAPSSWGGSPNQKMPARYTFVPELPRNPSGKVLRRQLRQDFWTGRERQVN